MNRLGKESEQHGTPPGGHMATRGKKGPSQASVHLLMVVAATLVSTSFTVGRAITHGLDPAVLTLLRFFLAAVLFAPYIIWRFGVHLDRSLFFRCALISLSLVIFFCCMFLSLRYTTALHTSVIFALVPSMAGGYALLLLGERLTRERLLALACGMVGVIWVVFRGDLGLLLAMEWNVGDQIFFGGCCAMALYTPLVKLLHRGEPMAIMTFWVLVTGSLWLLIFTGYRLPEVEWSAVPTTVWAGIAYLAVFTTIITFFLTQYAVPHLGPTRVMAYSYLYPALVLLLDLLLGYGLPPLRVLPGILVIVAAMFVLQRQERPLTVKRF
ncbi:MAG TPA: DMT family transporter [Desulforhopalus sp.]|nr:DMT family transporter [Desulforhopalus sp.]